MKKLAYLIALTGIWAAPALAITLDLVPTTPAVIAGDSLDVAVVIAGTVAAGAPSIGAFDLDVDYDPAILMPTNVVFGPFLGDPDPFAFETFTNLLFLPGVVDLAEVSLRSPADLDALQPDSFILAILSFSALASGNAVLSFSQTELSDAFGNKLALVPEPGVLLLLGSGLVGLLGLRRSKLLRKA